MPDPPNIAQFTEQSAQTKLGNGVVGKLTNVLLAACAALASIGGAVAIAGKENSVYIAGGVGALLFVLILALGGAIIWFANKHPEAALLEGAEFLKHEELKFSRMGQPTILVDLETLTTDPALPPPQKSLPPPTQPTERGESDGN